jgi:hypothetical protein
LRLKKRQWRFRREVEISRAEIHRGKGLRYKYRATAAVSICGSNSSVPQCGDIKLVVISQNGDINKWFCHIVGI